jgi:hypothetical protein
MFSLRRYLAKSPGYFPVRKFFAVVGNAAPSKSMYSLRMRKASVKLPAAVVNPPNGRHFNNNNVFISSYLFSDRIFCPNEWSIAEKSNKNVQIIIYNLAISWPMSNNFLSCFG